MKTKYMKIALIEAQKAYKKDEVPVGAIIVYNNKIIAKAHNVKERKKNPLAHAELIAIKKATKKIKNWRLDGCSIYVTLEPCPMCASAIQQCRIENIYYGVKNSDIKNHELLINICEGTNINRSVKYFGGILEEECQQLLKKFFKRKRK